MKIAELLIEKIRWNVLAMAILIAYLIKDFGDKLIERLPENIQTDVLIAIVGVGIGGLLASLSRMFDSPSVPADMHERVVRSYQNDDAI